MAAVLRGRLLGRFEIDVDGRVIERSAFERPSGARLLKLLLATPGHRVRRESAAELLWPEMDPERSAASLRKALFFARRALDGESAESASVITGDAEALSLRGGLTLDLDVDRLRRALDGLRTGRDGDAAVLDALQVVADLAGDELLPEDPYEEWLVPLRERLGQQTLDALRRGAAAARATGDRELAFRLVDRSLALDPADEAAHRLAIELHVDAGQLHAARRQLLACSRALAESYGVVPSPELAALIEAAAAKRAAVPSLAGEPPIIGRRRELEAAEEALDAVGAGRLGMAIYRGAPGIGKTRVLRELARSAAAAGWRIVEARGLEASPAAAFGEIGSALSRSLGGTLPAGLQEPGRSALQTIAPTFGGPPAVTFASDAALSAGLVDALGQLARREPLVLAVDDIQWLQESSVDLLASVAGALDDAPVLLIGAVRDSPDRLSAPAARLLDVVERAGGQVLRLGPVGRREAEQLLERELGTRLDQAVVDAVMERSGGAPLFALEVVRAARDAGLLVERGGLVRLASPNAALPVPPAVGLMVARRTAGLGKPAARILQIAAELGDDVHLPRLSAAAAPSSAGDVLDALDVGISAGLLVERSGGYGFAHPLFRSALREAVRPRERGNLHLRVAETLATGIDPTDGAAIDAAVASGRDVVAVAAHALAAFDLGRPEAIRLAVGFGIAAGERHAALFDHASAAATLHRALALWTRLDPDGAGAYPASRATITLGWSHHALGDEAAAARAFRAATARGRDESERALAWQALAWMPYQHGRFEEAEAILIEGQATLGDRVARASLEADLAWIDGRRGNWRRAYDRLARAVDVLDAGEAPAGLLARSLDRLGVAMRDAVDAVGSVAILERAHGLAVAAGDARLAGVIRMHLGGVYRQIGDVEAARREIDAALRSCSMTGDAYIEAVSVWIAAEVEHVAGRFREAIALRRRELELLHRLGGNAPNEGMAHAHIAYLARQLGDADLEASAAQAARLVARHAGLPHLPKRIETALASTTWFIDDVVPPGVSGNAAGTRPLDPSAP